MDWNVFGNVGYSIAAFIFVISVLVFVHEYGHYWVAKRNKVAIDAFSIGFGPRLFGWRDKSGTDWKFCAIPMGGYVQMKGDVDPSSLPPSEQEKHKMSPEDKAQSFYAKSLGQRAAIVFAGPAANFIFAIIILIGLFITFGQSTTLPRVVDVTPGMPAAVAGIQAGDMIKRINDNEITSFKQIVRAMALEVGQPVNIEVDRAGERLVFTITPEQVDAEGVAGIKHKAFRLGITGGEQQFTKLGLGEAIIESVKETWNIVSSTFTGLYQMIVGDRSSREMGGVLTIAKMSGDMAASVASLLWFMAMLSINLGLINLFPIPVLDGGHLAMYGLEAVRGKPLGDRAQEYSWRFGLALVLSLMMFALWNDMHNLGVVAFVNGLFS